MSSGEKFNGQVSQRLIYLVSETKCVGGSQSDAFKPKNTAPIVKYGDGSVTHKVDIIMKWGLPPNYSTVPQTNS